MKNSRLKTESSLFRPEVLEFQSKSKKLVINEHKKIGYRSITVSLFFLVLIVLLMMEV